MAITHGIAGILIKLRTIKKKAGRHELNKDRFKPIFMFF